MAAGFELGGTENGAMGLGSNLNMTELYTRGGMQSDRGQSLVERHNERMQMEKENAAMEKLAGLMPQFGTAIRALALKESVYDVETALSVLRAFQSQNDETLRALHKKRRKLKEAEAEAVKRAEAEAAAAAAAADASSSSSSESSSGSSSDSGSDDSGERKRRRKGSSKRSSKDKKRKRSSKDKKKGKDKKERKEKRAKDEGRAKLTASEDFGKFGIIRETDAGAKRPEFILWAIDVKGVDVESLSRPDERELFKDFMEDYNTGTLPHRKYYNLELYERQKAAKEASRAGKRAEKQASKPSVLGDEEALRRGREEERQRLAAERLKEAYEELTKTDKARDMREQDLLRLEMQAAYKVGDIKKAQRIQERLMTDDEKRAKGLIK